VRGAAAGADMRAVPTMVGCSPPIRQGDGAPCAATGPAARRAPPRAGRRDRAYAPPEVSPRGGAPTRSPRPHAHADLVDDLRNAVHAAPRPARARDRARRRLARRARLRRRMGRDDDRRRRALPAPRAPPAVGAAPLAPRRPRRVRALAHARRRAGRGRRPGRGRRRDRVRRRRRPRQTCGITRAENSSMLRSTRSCAIRPPKLNQQITRPGASSSRTHRSRSTAASGVSKIPVTSFTVS
jgi:hypothetical protein